MPREPLPFIICWVLQIGLRAKNSKGHRQFKDGTAYRQVRPTKLDKIKNFPDQVQSNNVISRLSAYN